MYKSTHLSIHSLTNRNSFFPIYKAIRRATTDWCVCVCVLWLWLVEWDGKKIPPGYFIFNGSLTGTKRLACGVRRLESVIIRPCKSGTV